MLVVQIDDTLSCHLRPVYLTCESDNKTAVGIGLEVYVSAHHLPCIDRNRLFEK